MSMSNKQLQEMTRKHFKELGWKYYDRVLPLKEAQLITLNFEIGKYENELDTLNELCRNTNINRIGQMGIIERVSWLELHLNNLKTTREELAKMNSSKTIDEILEERLPESYLQFTYPKLWSNKIKDLKQELYEMVMEIIGKQEPNSGGGGLASNGFWLGRVVISHRNDLRREQYAKARRAFKNE